MKNKGFYIKSVIATGEGMITSRVDFKDGCNLLFGPSEKGKSSVFSLIDYMLGKDEPPKLPPQGKGYNTFYMEFVTKEEGMIHTAKRILDEKVVAVKTCAYEQYDNEDIQTAIYHFSGKRKTYSQFLMELNGFPDGLLLRKSTTDKANFTYSWVRHLILADENRIVSENPIFQPQNDRTTQTQEKSVIYFLTTGKDDGNFQTQEKAELRKSRYEGMIQLTLESIDAVNSKIQELGDVTYADLTDENTLESLQAKMAEGDSHLKSFYIQREKLEDEKRQAISKKLFMSEFIKRMVMLQKHCLIDLERYEFLFDGASLMNILTGTHVCPICKSELKENVQIDENFLTVIQDEYNRVKSKLGDIGNLISTKKEEEKKLVSQIDSLTSQLETIQHKINNFTSQISSIKSVLERFQINIEKKAEARFLQEESRRLYKKLESLKKEKSHKPQVPVYNRQTSIDEEFCNLIKEKLAYWNVIGDNELVVFDEEGFDFVLGGKERITCGKGARGVTCSAILMSLLEFCQLKDIPFSNVLVLDSPLTAHFSDGKMDAEETTQTRFFKYCNDKIKDYQLIVVDNKSPELNERKSLSNIHFIEFSEVGFYRGKEQCF